MDDIPLHDLVQKNYELRRHVSELDHLLWGIFGYPNDSLEKKRRVDRAHELFGKIKELVNDQ